MAWDADGTVVLLSKGGGGIPWPATTRPWTNSTEMTLADMQKLNDENTATWIRTDWIASAWHMPTLLFPEKRDIHGLFINSTGGPSGYNWSAYSKNTTNSYDGTWTDLDYAGDSSLLADRYRTDIVSKVATGVVSLTHCNNSGGGIIAGYEDIYALHVYGVLSAGETPDRFLFLDPVSFDAEFTKVLDFGDVPRGQTQVRQVKVKNNSSTKTANTVLALVEALTGDSDDWYTLSTDGVSYQTTLSLGSIGPGGTKSIHLKQVVPAAAIPGPQVARVKVDQASWS